MSSQWVAWPYPYSAGALDPSVGYGTTGLSDLLRRGLPVDEQRGGVIDSSGHVLPTSHV